ncbi:nicotinate-nucleotide--dimethylbenzimidazole phosphoribosyltransferase [Streptomyces gamaensis]|uniref:Nicotinate-nucleotide--dimethylbenzimidazole phosphoribosyltransferase n=1 Tax=Streptomyces gamaensis TaxID=1763542 RepID=A0ABW0Z612_9ACTN
MPAQPVETDEPAVVDGTQPVSAHADGPVATVGKHAAPAAPTAADSVPSAVDESARAASVAADIAQPVPAQPAGTDEAVAGEGEHPGAAGAAAPVAPVPVDGGQPAPAGTVAPAPADAPATGDGTQPGAPETMPPVTPTEAIGDIEPTAVAQAPASEPAPAATVGEASPAAQEEHPAAVTVDEAPVSAAPVPPVSDGSTPAETGVAHLTQAAPEPESAPQPVPHGTPAGQPEPAAPVPAQQPRHALHGEAGAGQPAAGDGESVPAPVQDVPAPEPGALEEPVAQETATEPEAQPALPEVPAGPPAEGYAESERAAVHRVMRERRDIRNGFRSDPIPHEVLLRVLEAAHTAPSVGHSQPWDFVVIRSAETRRTMHELAMRQRDAYAKSLPKARAKQFKELKVEAILDTPVNIVVTADPTRGGRHTLGRHTQPQMAPYSSALAVENLWLAARAEGLGVGWVSFFDEREMVRTLGLPEHLDVVAYLCVGYVDEFPDEPELMQAGWSKRRPLSWVVHEEAYGRRALPGEDPHDLLAETLRGIRPLDAKALGEAWERQKRMTKPSGALGMLEIISAQLCGLSRKCPPPIPEPAAVAIFAGDHGVHAQGVTAWPQEVTSQMVANFLGGGAVCNAFANQVGAEVCVVDVGVAAELPATPGLLPRKVRPGTSDITTGPAMTREEALRAVEVGIETARDLVAAGNRALITGEMGIANTTVSAALIAVYTGADPAEITGRGTGINDETHARKIDVVRRALELHRPDPEDPIGVLTAVGGLEHAALVGLILGGASLRTPVILDGVSAGAAALVARALAPEALAACIAGHRSAEPGHVAALTKLGLRPLVDLDLRLGEGTGALLALPVVQSAARAMHEVATFDTAGVTEKG